MIIINILIIFITHNLLLFILNFELLFFIFYIYVYTYTNHNRTFLYYYTYSFLGSLFQLFNIFISYYLYGSTYSIFISSLPIYLNLILILSFIFKLPLYPFDKWLPLLHTHSPTNSSIILSSIIIKIGIYGLYIYTINIKEIKLIIMTIIMIGLLRNLYFFFFLLDFKLYVAYSSIIHMSLIYISYIYGNVSMNGIIGHTLISSILFKISGILKETYNTRYYIYLRSLITFNPILTIILIIGLLFNIGLPISRNFLGEIEIYRTIDINILKYIIIITIPYYYISIILIYRLITGEIYYYKIESRKITNTIIYLIPSIKIW